MRGIEETCQPIIPATAATHTEMKREKTEKFLKREEKRNKSSRYWNPLEPQRGSEAMKRRQLPHTCEGVVRLKDRKGEGGLKETDVGLTCVQLSYSFSPPPPLCTI